MSAEHAVVDGLAVTRRRARRAEGPEPATATPFGPDDVTPTRPTVLFVHGAMDRAASFGRVMRRLDELDTIAVDRRGYAGSVAAGTAGSLREHATDLLAVIDWSGAERVVVVGHSLGGRVALELGAMGDRRVVAVAAFEAPAPELDESGARVGAGAIEVGQESGPEAAAEHFYRRMVGDGTWSRLRERDRIARRAEGSALLAELVDLRECAGHLDLSSIPMPVSIGVGQRSDDELHRGSHALQEQLADACCAEIAGAGHGAHLTHPDEFARFVRRAVRCGDQHGPGADPFRRAR